MTDSTRPSVLLVDDRAENLLALEAVLAPLDVRLVSAQSGEEALRALLREDFAAILLDVQMPGMDGFETAELIRGRERTRHVPIIFVTAISKGLEHVARGYEAGAVDYVLKPFDPFVLRSKVQVFCDLERQRRERARADQLVRQAFQASPIGIAVVDRAGRVQEANPALCRLTGRDGTDLRSNLAEVFHVHDRAQLGALLAGDGDYARGELRVVDLAGGEIPVDVVAAPVADPDGELRRVLVQITDLRERRHALEAQQRLVAEQAARSEAEALATRLAKVAAINEGLDHLRLDEIVESLARRLVDVLGVRGAAVTVLGDDEARPVDAGHGAAVSTDLLQSAVAEGRPQSGAGEGSLAVPLRVEGRVVGAAAVVGADRTPDLPGLLRHAGERAALIIERARLFDRERRIAATLQEDLLPERLPDVPGLTLDAHFRSGHGGAQVGGDWYDAIALPGGRLGIVVGDVAGRGVAAAARMGELRAVARAYALEGHAPAELARRVNAYQLAQGADTMTTLLYAVVEPDRERLRFVSAGHLPPLLALEGDEPRFVAGAGPPLGVLDVCRYDEVVVPFGAGARLVLYTDGLVERRGEVLDEGLARLRSALAGAPDDVVAACEHVRDACLNGTPTDDDVTAVFVRAQERIGSPAQFVLTSDPDALGALRRTLRRWLAEVDASPDETAEITLAANEAWQNAIEHGNDFAAAPITVEFAARDEEILVTVRDLGHQGEHEPDPDRGRGIRLMRALMDEAVVDVGGAAGGSVMLRRRLASRVGAIGRS